MTEEQMEKERAAIQALVPQKPYMLADLLYAVTQIDEDVSVEDLVGARQARYYVTWRKRVWYLANTDLNMTSDQIGPLMNRDSSTVRYGLNAYLDIAESDEVALEHLRTIAKQKNKERKTGLRLCAS